MAYDQRALDDYIDVAQRIADFREKYPDGTLQPADPARPWEQAIVHGVAKDGKPFTATMIVYTAAAYRTPGDPRPGIGIAWEVFPGRTPYTAGSELQNAETSAWGRAIIAVGASDSKRGIVSREEVRNRQAEEAELAARELRRRDPEVDEHGAATVAEQTRMMRGREPGSSRLPATPGDDPWYDAGPQPSVLGAGELSPAQPENAPGSSLPRQRQAVHGHLVKLGFASPDAQRAECSRIAGRPVGSRKDLSYREAVLVLASTQRKETGNGE